MKAIEKSRFDTRLPKEQKEFFEYAANLGGFRTLTEFVVATVQQQASKIVERHNTILASKRNFNCNKSLLDNYLHAQAKQDVKRKLSACFILADDENNVKGYYTLSSTSIQRELLPESIIRKLQIGRASCRERV